MHISVLTNEVIEGLDLKPNSNVIDCTLGQGGHTKALLEQIKPDGKVLGIERDASQLSIAKTRVRDKRATLVQGNFADITEIVKENKFSSVKGILYDLGFSSGQIQESGRGFTFQKNEPLDMRYDINSPLTAEKILNFESKISLERIFKEYGEEKYAREIAQAIIQERAVEPITKTFQLVQIIENVVKRREKIHPATRTFQALRIATNDELGNLKQSLPKAVDILNINGRIAVISFHSLEDRIVKRFFQENEQLEIETKKPIIATDTEIKENKRSRSAKLRIAKKIQ